MLPMDIPIPNGEEIFKTIKEIKNKYGFNNSDMQP